MEQSNKNKQGAEKAIQSIDEIYSFDYRNVNAFFLIPLLTTYFNSMVFFLHSILTFLTQSTSSIIKIELYGVFSLSLSLTLCLSLSLSHFFLFAYWTVCSYQHREHNARCDGKVLAKRQQLRCQHFSPLCLLQPFLFLSLLSLPFQFL